MHHASQPNSAHSVDNGSDANTDSDNCANDEGTDDAVTDVTHDDLEHLRIHLPIGQLMTGAVSAGNQPASALVVFLNDITSVKPNADAFISVHRFQLSPVLSPSQGDKPTQ